jgi:hypothetical protein
MKKKLLPLLSSTVALFALSVSLFAHHGATRWERDKWATISGEVKQFDWLNPHPVLLLNVKNAEGNVEIWEIGFHPPGVMNRGLGWTRKTFLPGDQVKIYGHPEKPGLALPSGYKSLRPVKVTFSDGREHIVDPPGAKQGQAGGY